MKLYERQLNFVESILEFHPEFMNIFGPDEQEAFKKYFLPDWNRVEDFKEYHSLMTTECPELEEEATTLLRKFLTAHRVMATDLLP